MEMRTFVVSFLEEIHRKGELRCFSNVRKLRCSSNSSASTLLQGNSFKREPVQGEALYLESYLGVRPVNELLVT